MILVLSNNMDQSTSCVIDWLKYFKTPFIRVNETDECEVIEININNASETVIIKVNDVLLNLNDVSSYWYRRGDFNIKVASMQAEGQITFQDKINFNAKREVKITKEYMHYILNGKGTVLGNYFDNNINKISNLNIARRCGLLIPKTRITSLKNKVNEFINTENDVITKAISEAFMFLVKGKGTLQAYTCKVKESDLNDYGDRVFPSLFQEDVEKKYELRIFYLDGEFYSMAIFSQMSNKTITDYRNYDSSRPNRNVPYRLPNEIKIKLDKFMRNKGYKTGSIDMIVNKKGEYVFLEVNPIGQFGMTSQPCNYFIHKRIAEYLCVQK